MNCCACVCKLLCVGLYMLLNLRTYHCIICNQTYYIWLASWAVRCNWILRPHKSWINMSAKKKLPSVTYCNTTMGQPLNVILWMIKITGNALNVSWPKSQAHAETRNNCTFLWQQKGNNEMVQRQTKDIFCYEPARQLLLALNLYPFHQFLLSHPWLCTPKQKKNPFIAYSIFMHKC